MYLLAYLWMIFKLSHGTTFYLPFTFSMFIMPCHRQKVAKTKTVEIFSGHLPMWIGHSLRPYVPNVWHIKSKLHCFQYSDPACQHLNNWLEQNSVKNVSIRFVRWIEQEILVAGMADTLFFIYFVCHFFSKVSV